MNKFRRSLLSLLATNKEDTTPLFGKLDISFKDNKFNSIGTKKYIIRSDRELVYNNNNLILNGGAYLQIGMNTSDFTNESTIQVLVEATPTNDDITNWFRFAAQGTALVFGYMTNAVLTKQKPFVLTFLMSGTAPTIKTYINDTFITQANPTRYLWGPFLQIGAGDMHPKPEGLTIRRFRIFDTRINESEVKKYYEEMLANS